MRILVTVQPLESHVRAIQQVVNTARLLGHDVLLAAPAKVGRLIEETYQLPYAMAGEDWTTTPGIGSHLTRALVQGGNSGFCRAIISDYLTGPTAAKKSIDIVRLAQEWGPTAILCDCTDIGSLVAASRLGIQCIRLDNGWTRPLIDGADALADGLRRLWPQFDTDRYMASRMPTITPCPVDLVYPDQPHMTAYRVEHPRRVGDRLPRWFAEIPTDRPFVYASYGSILTRDPAFAEIIVPVYRRIIDALRGIKCTALLSVGRENAKALRRDLPGHIRVTAEIAQPLLLQSADVILFPGGLGTIKEILTNGVSPVVIPLVSENFYIARRFEETGLGVQVPFTAPAETIAEAIRTVLADPSYRQASRLWQRRALTLPPLEFVLGSMLD